MTTTPDPIEPLIPGGDPVPPGDPVPGSDPMPHDPVPEDPSPGRQDPDVVPSGDPGIRP